jgi:phage head maturation protease
MIGWTLSGYAILWDTTSPPAADGRHRFARGSITPDLWRAQAVPLVENHRLKMTVATTANRLELAVDGRGLRFRLWLRSWDFFDDCVLGAWFDGKISGCSYFVDPAESRQSGDLITISRVRRLRELTLVTNGSPPRFPETRQYLRLNRERS